MIAFPFELIAKTFHDIGDATAPSPLNAVIGLPFYLIAGTMLLVILLLKLVTIPFELVIASMQAAASGNASVIAQP